MRSAPAEQFDPRRLFEELFVLVVRREVGQHRVVLGVIADHEAVADLAFGRGAEVVDLLTDHEEGRGCVFALEHVEHLRRVRARAVVEGERDVAALRCPLL